jgi:mono/diheme cytochrome c family protein
MATLKNIITILFIALPAASFSQSEVWTVPPASASLVNPLEIKPKNLTVGKNIYMKNCVSCHGQKADGQGLIQSASFLTETFQKQPDGAIFHKMVTGRSKMPGFRGVLKDDEVWSVINYLRVLVNPSILPPLKDIKISLGASEEARSLTASIFTADSAKLPLAEVDVHYYVKRDFGFMTFGEISNYTSDKGQVTVSFPDDIIGDEQGNVLVYARVENDFLYKNAETRLSLKWGSPLVTEDTKFDQRTLWGSRSKSPVWLLILANGILAGVWGVILYILYNLFRIKKAGKIFIK